MMHLPFSMMCGGSRAVIFDHAVIREWITIPKHKLMFWRVRD
jgi:hypothetical protein